MPKTTDEKSTALKAKVTLDPKDLSKKLVLNGAEITAIGVEAELLVGGKNYNTAIIDQVPGERPHDQVGVHGGLSASEMAIPLIYLRPG